LNGEKTEEFLRRFEDGAPFKISKVMLQLEEKWYEATAGELLPEDKCLFKIERGDKEGYEEICEDIEETALPKKEKKKLRAALKDSEAFAVGISEVYSPPRVSEVARRRRISTGGSYDLQTGFDLRLEADLKKMWKELREDDPELTICSPPCTPFSLLHAGAQFSQDG